MDILGLGLGFKDIHCPVLLYFSPIGADPLLQDFLFLEGGNRVGSGSSLVQIGSVEIYMKKIVGEKVGHNGPITDASCCLPYTHTAFFLTPLPHFLA